MSPEVAKKIHPLCRHTEKAGLIRFIHSDGQEHSYYSCVNDLSGSRLSAFDGNRPTIGETIPEVRATFKAIKKKATRVIEVIGDF